MDEESLVSRLPRAIASMLLYARKKMTVLITAAEELLDILGLAMSTLSTTVQIALTIAQL